jgi:hypothetical protein
VSEGPSRPPKSDLNSDGQHQQNSPGWRLFFWVSAILMALVIVFVPLVDALSLFDWIDLGFSIVGTVGLYGFAYYKPLGSMIFWRYFFYAVLVESFIYSIVLPLAGAEQYGQPVNFDSSLLLSFAYLLFYLIALNAYAYKRPFVWK